jgi:hypothetical protein
MPVFVSVTVFPMMKSPVEVPTVSMPSQPIRWIRLPRIRAWGPPVQIPPFERPFV